jgi:glucose/arabinose dehydrogenase
MRAVKLAAVAGAVLGALSLAGAASAAPVASVGPLEATPLAVATGANPGNAAGKSLNLPQGWTAEVWANVPGARMAAWTPDGRLLVSTGDNGSLKMLTPTTPGAAPTIKTLRSGHPGIQGIGFANNGKVLILGENTRIVTYSYSNGVLTNPKTIVNHLPSSGHGAKGIAVKGDLVFYSLGSTGNRTAYDRTASPPRATIWAVKYNGTSKMLIAKGVRNGFGLAIGPGGTVFTAVNQMDNQPYPFKDGTGNYGKVIQSYVNENPVDQVTRLTKGIDLGWPYCVPDIRNNPDRLNVPFVSDPLLNPTGQKLNCAALPRTQLGLPAHSAPLGLTFTTGTTLESVVGNGALITTHGSWNRVPPRAPVVYFSPWNSTTKSLGATETLVGGFQNSDGSRWGRCVASVVGPDGSLYVTDDYAGLVYRITPGPA